MRRGPQVKVEILTVGTELLLGHIVDTNAAWLAGELAGSGVDCYHITTVGDHVDRIVEALSAALSRAEAVIVCGGLGPTHDDVTRDALAAVMKVALVRDDALVEKIRGMFVAKGRTMAASNARQADVPSGAMVIPQRIGTAPGLICPVESPTGSKVIYALPGVPSEMKEMALRAVFPELIRRRGSGSVIMSRVIRTWGLPESVLAEILAPRIRELDANAADSGNGMSPTLAFQASGIDGVKVRVTVKAADALSATILLDSEEEIVRGLLGDAVFGVDSVTMEIAVGAMLAEGGLTLGLAESVTGGLIASRIVATPGASTWFRGSVVAYGSGVKQDVLGISDGPVVKREAAREMAEAARRLFGAAIGLATTGVAGPDRQENVEVGTVHVGLSGPGEHTAVLSVQLPGDREQVRQLASISALDLLRRELISNSRHV